MKTAARAKRPLNSVEHLLRNSIETNIKPSCINLFGTILQATAPDIQDARPPGEPPAPPGASNRSLEALLATPFGPPRSEPDGGLQGRARSEKYACPTGEVPECGRLLLLLRCFIFSLHLTQHEECSRHCTYVDFRMTLTSREVHRAP